MHNSIDSAWEQTVVILPYCEKDDRVVSAVFNGEHIGVRAFIDYSNWAIAAEFMKVFSTGHLKIHEDEFWFLDGYFHRDTGPAVMLRGDSITYHWYRNGSLKFTEMFVKYEPFPLEYFAYDTAPSSNGQDNAL